MSTVAITASGLKVLHISFIFKSSTCSGLVESNYEKIIFLKLKQKIRDLKENIF
jgi:hypothetical protein